ncbi:LPS export ABC transporter periplasmic protein LptC [Thalassotalea maritima]|uniref:LPS export ABC transporter periplasmic protein LptC n=1 Tax=Thalassotalea maritima TaxID=3242416 RepID=UPI003526DA2A
MSKLHYVSIALFVLALSIYGYLQYQQSSQMPEPLIDPVDEPAFIAEQLSSSQYDSDGNLKHTIYADQMTYFEQSKQANLLTPAYTIYPDDGSAIWTLSADKGFLGNDNILILQDRVRLVSDDKNAYVSEVAGEHLQLDLTSNIITSEQTIYLKGKGFTMHGSGLHVDINTTKLTLKEHVQTVFNKNDS